MRFDGRDVTAPAGRTRAAAPASPARTRSRIRSGHDRVRERAGRCDASAATAPARGLRPASRRSSGPACRPGQPPAGSLTLLERKRLELARALATGPRVLLLDEIAGGLTEPEVARAGRDRSGGSARPGVAIVWIEHIVHALLSVVDRLVAIDFGRKLVEGDPHDGHGQPGGARRLPGHRGCRDACSRSSGLAGFYGDFQALFDVVARGRRGRDRRHHRRQRRRQVDPARTVAGLLRRRPAARRASTARPSAAVRAHAPVEPGIALVPEGRRIFPSLTSRRTCWSAPTASGRAVDARRGLRAVPGPGRAARPAGHAASRAASSRCWPSAAALMANPRLLLLDEVSLGLAPVVVKQLYEVLPGSARRGTTRARGRAGRRPGAGRRRARLLPARGRGRARRAGPPS